MEDRYFYVYIMTNYKNTVLYTGSTASLKARIWQHKQKLVKGFTKRYNVNKLVYYEVCEDYFTSLGREHQIKAGPRSRKIDLIDTFNPEWKDLYDDID